MKLLHVIPRFIGGGPERSILALAERDRRLGRGRQHNVAVLDAPVSAPLFLQARRAGVAVMVRPAPDAMLRAVEAADLVQLHYWNHPALTAVLREVVLPPTRLLLWARILGTGAPQVLFADLGRFADRLVLTSDLSAASAAVRTAIGLGRPVDIVPSILDTGRLEGFSPRPHEGICVGYVGSVNPSKMHPRFAELCLTARTPGLRFVVCGSGGGEAALRERFAALGAGGRIEVRGHVEDVGSALAEFDIFGYPLTEGTFATSERALQEAMWVGLPPLVFPHGGVAALVEHERTGLVARDEPDYAAALDRLAGDAALRRRLGDAARCFARTAFDPERWSHPRRAHGSAAAAPRAIAGWQGKRRGWFRPVARRPGGALRHQSRRQPSA
jgi:glycosyltransferase involved in cell wall biosynthesis